MGADIHVDFQAKLNGKWVNVKCDYPFIRNYLFFAWLADVRNRFGVKPLSKPRGLPKDYLSDPEFGFADHSESWLSVDEIINAPDQIISYKGCITNEDFKKWSGVGRPNAMIIYDTDSSGRPNMVDISWSVSIKEEFLEFINAISSLQNEYGEVRMIFGFDS